MSTEAPVDRSIATLQSRSQLEPGKTMTAAFMARATSTVCGRGRGSGALVQHRDRGAAVGGRERGLEAEGVGGGAECLEQLQLRQALLDGGRVAGGDPPEAHVDLHVFEPLAAPAHDVAMGAAVD